MLSNLKGKSSQEFIYTHSNVSESSQTNHESPDRASARPKPPVRTSRLPPWPEFLLYIACIVAAAFLFGLCSQGIYFADYDQPNVTTILNVLQFVAKMHEMLLGGAVGAIVIDLTIFELCAGRGLSVSYVTYAFQLSKVEQLLTKDFWSRPKTSQNSMDRPCSRLIGIALTVISIFLAILGPSSAILLLPDLNWWRVPDPFSGHKGIMYFTQSFDALWPRSLSSTSPGLGDTAECIRVGPMGTTPPPRCPFNMMPEISQWLINNYNRGSPPNLTKSADLGIIRYLTSSDNDKPDAYVTSNVSTHGYAVGSSASTFLARNLDAIWLYAEMKNLDLVKPSRPRVSLTSTGKNATLRRPLVQVQCGFPLEINNLTEVEVDFPTDRLITNSSFRWESGSPVTMNVTDFQNLTSGPMLKWLDLSSHDQPLLGVAVGMKFFSPQLVFGQSFNGPEAVALMPCTITAHWIPTALARDPLFGSTLVVDNADPMVAVQNATVMAESIVIKLETSYMEYLNQPVQDREKPLGVIAWILDWLTAHPGGQGHAFDGYWRARWPWLVATTMSLQLTDALARYADGAGLFYWDVAPNTSINESFVVDLRYINNGNSYNHELPKAYNYSLADHVRAAPDLYTVIDWTVDRYGYAWSFGRPTKDLAAAVLATHTLLVLCYLMFILVRKWRCNNWKTLSELFILALQSPRSKIPSTPAFGLENDSLKVHNIQILEDIIEDKRIVLEVRDSIQVSKSNSDDVHFQMIGSVYDQARRLKPEKRYR